MICNIVFSLKACLKHVKYDTVRLTANTFSNYEFVSKYSLYLQLKEGKVLYKKSI